MLGLRWADRCGVAAAPRLGIQLQETQLAEKLTVEETLRLFRSFYPERARRVDELLALVGLEAKRDAWVGKLSGGQKQRLSVACALVGGPEVLFLDEPTTGLDPQSRLQLWDVLERFKARGGTMLLTTHYMDEAATLCDRVGVVDQGRLIAAGHAGRAGASLGHAARGRDSTSTTAPRRRRRRWRALAGRARRAARRPHQVSLGSLGDPRDGTGACSACCAAAGVAVRELATHSATLEDVFVSLTGRHLRDG